jgi:cyclic pyranopterin phosphate synthase
MVPVGDKESTHRIARARGFVSVSTECMDLIRSGKIKKGDPLEIARIAGTMAAKKTHELVPLCHQLLLTHISVDLQLEDHGVSIDSRVECTGKTGVEMEALTAVSAAALTVYDMLKAVDKNMVIREICLVEKQGGRSGHYIRSEEVSP